MGSELPGAERRHFSDDGSDDYSVDGFVEGAQEDDEEVNYFQSEGNDCVGNRESVVNSEVAEIWMI